MTSETQSVKPADEIQDLIENLLTEAAPSFRKVRQSLLVSCSLEAGALLIEREELSRWHFYRRSKLNKSAKELRSTIPMIHKMDDVEIANFVTNTPESFAGQLERRKRRKDAIGRYVSLSGGLTASSNIILGDGLVLLTQQMGSANPEISETDLAPAPTQLIHEPSQTSQQ